ncbi:hypothetical protein DAPPUDRAFT_315385 [Daphnia pulex]|uniref:Uncharacterized protein n=1 Tax=Daphnia pulex TaxID=6669 RepID=E9G9K8_DAPPU|nr:hypothetical protein DAPPUDRAFT_315385 [Daphnia pulex]|eukprot:EFX83863.1 hypothetical protein DAPPUDRAFT_315385 [Daphnia pulex]
MNSKFIEYDDTNKIYAASLCVSCSDALIVKRIPMHSLANGVDYGDALAFDLEELTFQRKKQAALTGHMITFPQPDDILMTEITRINSNLADGRIYPRVDDFHLLLSVVFVGERQQYFRVLKALHPAYKNIVIDDSKEMSSKPSKLLKRAEIIHGEMEYGMDKMVLDDCDNQTDLLIVYLF